MTGQGVRPPLRVKAWDAAQRSAWTQEDGRIWLDINKHYPLYKVLRGAKPYLAETAILELCKKLCEADGASVAEYLDRVNLMLVRWSEIADEASAP